MSMKVKGKHRELLVELLIYYLANSRYGIKQEFFTGVIKDIKKQNSDGNFWIKEFIDASNVFSRY